jgi:hypothetical protein
MDPPSTPFPCHIERRKTNSEESKVAIVAELAAGGHKKSGRLLT